MMNRRPLAEAARQLSQRLDYTIRTAQSECWWSATTFYTTLARVAAADDADSAGHVT